MGRNPNLSERAPLGVTLDIVGFSRGAASAREFSNMVVDRIESGYYRDMTGGCATISVRMMSLFDTVLSTAVSNWGGSPFRMVIPAQVQYVAHAVASNEYRSSFPVESIEPSFAAIRAGGYSRGARTERAFVGAHADIGGGYNGTGGDGGDLSDVALNWMVEQARIAGVRMQGLPPELQNVANPILHDETRTALWSGLGERSTDRQVRVRGTNRNDTGAPVTSPGRSVQFVGGMGHTASQRYIVPLPLPERFSNIVGDIRMCDYASWLNANYGMSVSCQR
jgi:hypothetical protein